MSHDHRQGRPYVVPVRVSAVERALLEAIARPRHLTMEQLIREAAGLNGDGQGVVDTVRRLMAAPPDTGA